MPSALLYGLEPQSQAALEPGQAEESADGSTEIAVRGTVVKVYEQEAEAILGLGDAARLDRLPAHAWDCAGPAEFQPRLPSG